MTGPELIGALRTRLKGLQAQITVDDRSADDAEGLHETEGQLRLTSERLNLMLSCSADIPGAEDLLTLALSLAEELFSFQESPESLQQAYRLLLEGELPAVEYDRLQRQYGLREHQNRCVLIFRSPEQSVRIAGLMEEIAPLDTGDALIPWKRGQTLLIKSAGRISPEEEMVEYAEALQETWLGETGYPLKTGIGTVTASLTALAQSAAEAEKALDIGGIFHPERSVYAFRKLLLERFLNDIPQKLREEYQAVLFHKGTAKLFDEELLTTLDMFFEKDLNVSDAARQLYIHRNTLMYRLDKVQRATGLDLRKFEDAVVFKLLMELRRCGDHLKGGK